MQTKEDICRLKTIDCFFIDLDGTFYLGNKLFQGSTDFLKICKEKNKKYIFLTNNSSKDASDYIEKLKNLGVNITKDQILTSGEATVQYLKGINPGSKVFVLGTPSLKREFESAGFIIHEDNPQYVIVGFDLTLTYEKLCKACEFIRNGAKFIATHPDFNCPTEKGYIPDCGAIIAAITASTGVTPKIIGKPNKEMIHAAMKKAASRKNNSAIIGDRLYTDMAMGKAAGITSILVLTGETKIDDLSKADVIPNFVFESIGDLANHLQY